jgi:hypothetical protein
VSGPSPTRPTWTHFLRVNLIPILVVGVALVAVTVVFALADPAIGLVVGAVILIAGIVVHWLRSRPIDREQTHSVGSVLTSGFLGTVIVLVVIQLVPYGRDHSNPPITAEPEWDSPVTRELAVRACFDCHSNEVAWPWYSNVAPFSWAAQRHVEEGREALNLSEMDRPQHEVDEAAETVIEGEMPPRYYTLMHSTARLTDAERMQLIDGLEATLGGDHDRGDGRDDDHDDGDDDDD